MQTTTGLVDTLIRLPIFQSEWVLWLLIGLSVLSIMVVIERAIFYRRHSVDSEALRKALNLHLRAGDYEGAAKYLGRYDSLESNVVLFGLLEHARGPDAVEDLIDGAEAKERVRYSRRLNLLATVGSNAPFIGLFGTVLGIIRAFRDLSTDLGNAGGTVMAGISEALIATAVGLIVAIPAVIAYNTFKSRVAERVANGRLLTRTLLSDLKSADRPASPAPASAEVA